MQKYNLAYAQPAPIQIKYEGIINRIKTVLKALLIAFLITVAVLASTKASFSSPADAVAGWFTGALQSMADEMVMGLGHILTEASYTTGDALVKGMVRGFGPNTNLFSAVFNGWNMSYERRDTSLNAIPNGYTLELTQYSQIFGTAIAIILFLCGLIYWPISDKRKNDNNPFSLFFGFVFAMVLIMAGAKSLDPLMDVCNQIWTNYVMTDADAGELTFTQLLPGDVSAIYSPGSTETENEDKELSNDELSRLSRYDSYVIEWFNGGQGEASGEEFGALPYEQKVQIRQQFWNAKGWDGLKEMAKERERDLGTHGDQLQVLILGVGIMAYATTPLCLLLPLILLLIAWPLIKGFLQLYAAIIERYIIVCIMYFCFPAVACTTVLKNTRRIFTSYISMIIGQMFLLIISVTFMKMTVFGITHEHFTRSVPNYIFGLAFIKCAQGLERIMLASGLSVTQSGGAFMSNTLGAMMLLTRAPRALQGIASARDSASDALQTLGYRSSSDAAKGAFGALATVVSGPGGAISELARSKKDIENAGGYNEYKLKHGRNSIGEGTTLGQAGATDVTRSFIRNTDQSGLYKAMSDKDQKLGLEGYMSGADSRLSGINVDSSSIEAGKNGIKFQGDYEGNNVSGHIDKSGISLNNNLPVGEMVEGDATDLGIRSGSLAAIDDMGDNFSSNVGGMMQGDDKLTNIYDTGGNVIGTYDGTNIYEPTTQMSGSNPGIHGFSNSELSGIAQEMGYTSLERDLAHGKDTYKATQMEGGRKKTTTVKIKDINNSNAARREVEGGKMKSFKTRTRTGTHSHKVIVKEVRPEKVDSQNQKAPNKGRNEK